ncbi:hypothetical protein NsoK4_09710 [Nitrosopumilus sp. K4]|uniref:hypothetical protein n=1 Tax=Nitrosopumilus sp. K4 TaxID=2795383 RepID=UPI001BA926EB|nr:hypothetical protein [Nitrosopumilus sp. K4]QUC65750.1 hypothetical protein NsoK4_09710 [Nitrosopumilus sp. K4]
MTVYAAIAGLLALMGGFVFYASLDNPHLEQVEIKLGEVTVRDVNKIENTAKLEVTFYISNPSEKTFTVPVISYQLFADGVLLGSGQYSTEDIAMPGRAVFYPGAEIPLKNTFVLVKENVDSNTYDSILNGNISNFSAEGSITSETSWSIIEKDFTTNQN